jgi:hypothetical protein
MLKDPRFSQQAASATAAAAPLGEHAATIYDAIAKDGDGGIDFSGIVDDQTGTTKMSYQAILVERQERVALVTLNGPKPLNALKSELTRELCDPLADLERDPGIDCIVITWAELSVSLAS